MNRRGLQVHRRPDLQPTRAASGEGVAHHPIPLMILARLAISLSRTGKGIGSGLLKDVLRRTLAAAEIAGLRAMAVHAKDDEARTFYDHFNFIPSPTDPMHLFVPLKDVRGLLSER